MSNVKFQIRRQGNLADLSVLSGEFPSQLKETIEDQLSYNHVSQLRGQEAYSVSSWFY